MKQTKTAGEGGCTGSRQMPCPNGQGEPRSRGLLIAVQIRLGPLICTWSSRPGFIHDRRDETGVRGLWSLDPALSFAQR